MSNTPNATAITGPPTPGNGSEWTDPDIFAAKEWFAKNCLKRAMGLALVVMARYGVVDHTLAEDATLEWLAGRFDRMTQGFDSARGDFAAFALTDLRLYVTGTFLKKARTWLNRRRSIEWTSESGSSIETADGWAEREAPHGQRFHERLETLTHVLQRLSADEREILLLAAAESDCEEIAEHLGITKGAARVRLCRARAEARRLFCEEEGSGDRRRI